MRDKKQDLRVRTLLQREGLSASDLLTRSRLIKERVLSFPTYLESNSVMLYSPVGNEVSTEGIRDHALSHGKKVFYPRLGKREELDSVRIKSCTDLRPGRFGILEPVGDEIMVERDQEALVVFVPGLAFDLRGNRLGRGRGSYDRALRRLGEYPRVVALAFEFQIVEELPVEEWDEKVHQIITEKRIIDCPNVATQSGYVL
jgi:5-formyltetrahydrofolate cyclo-ligase